MLVGYTLYFINIPIIELSFLILHNISFYQETHDIESQRYPNSVSGEIYGWAYHCIMVNIALSLMIWLIQSSYFLSVH